MNSYQDWLDNHPNGFWICLKCNVEMSSESIRKFEQDKLIRAIGTSYFCPNCDKLEMKWYSAYRGRIMN